MAKNRNRGGAVSADVVQGAADVVQDVPTAPPALTAAQRLAQMQAEVQELARLAAQEQALEVRERNLQGVRELRAWAVTWCEGADATIEGAEGALAPDVLLTEWRDRSRHVTIAQHDRTPGGTVRVARALPAVDGAARAVRAPRAGVLAGASTAMPDVGAYPPLSDVDAERRMGVNAKGDTVYMVGADPTQYRRSQWGTSRNAIEAPLVEALTLTGDGASVKDIHRALTQLGHDYSDSQVRHWCRIGVAAGAILCPLSGTETFTLA